MPLKSRAAVLVKRTVDDLCRREGAADDGFGEQMHLHITAVALESDPDPGAEMEYVANAYHPRGEVGGGERVLYAEDEHSAGRKHSYEFAEVVFRESARHVLEDDVAVEEGKASVIKRQFEEELAT